MTLVEVLEAEELSQTKISRRTDRIIDRLDSKLRKIITQIKDEMPDSNLFAIKNKYQTQVHNLIRFAIEDSYFAGLDYSDKALGERQPVTIKDVQRLDQLTEEGEARFWRIVMRLEKIKEFSFTMVLSLISTIISDILTKSLNTATITNLEPITPIDYTTTIQVMFKTREDEKVCQICEPYNNNVYDINDDTKPEIPDDTHPNCRCRFVVYQDGKPIIERLNHVTI